MADITNPGIRKELEDAEGSLNGYGETATVLLRHHSASAMALVPAGLLPGRDKYQHEVNERLLDLIKDVSMMAAYTAGAVWSLKAVIELMAKGTPKPKPAPPPGLFDSRK